MIGTVEAGLENHVRHRALLPVAEVSEGELGFGALLPEAASQVEDVLFVLHEQQVAVCRKERAHVVLGVIQQDVRPDEAVQVDRLREDPAGAHARTPILDQRPRGLAVEEGVAHGQTGKHEEPHASGLCKSFVFLTF